VNRHVALSGREGLAAEGERTTCFALELPQNSADASSARSIRGDVEGCCWIREGEDRRLRQKELELFKRL
jgi:hypothetical protein